MRRINSMYRHHQCHSLQLVLEVIIDVIDSPLVANFTFMLKNVLPGADFMYTILELMSSENVSVKVGAINLLSLFLSAPDGQVNIPPDGVFCNACLMQCVIRSTPSKWRSLKKSGGSTVWLVHWLEA